MTFRHRLIGIALVALAAAAAVGQAQSLPGVGYEPGARGFYMSAYKLDSLNNPYTPYTMDLAADPGVVGAHPNPYYLSFSDPVVRAAYEQRYGPNTTGPRMKSWVGPGNEVRGVIVQSLRWWFANRPQFLGGWSSGRTGEPTEREITDVQATGDREIWQAYLIAAVPGFSPDNRELINDPALPPGDGQRKNQFWNMTNYYHNSFSGYYPFSPQVPVPGSL